MRNHRLAFVVGSANGLYVDQWWDGVAVDVAKVKSEGHCIVVWTAGNGTPEKGASVDVIDARWLRHFVAPGSTPGGSAS
jgi:hypothetical protein